MNLSKKALGLSILASLSLGAATPSSASRGVEDLNTRDKKYPSCSIMNLYINAIDKIIKRKCGKFK